MRVTVAQAAKHADVDPCTVRRDIQRDGSAFVIRKGKRGPGNGALLDLQKYISYRGQATGPTPEEIVEKIAEALEAALLEERADIRADVEKRQAAAVLIVAYEQCCLRFAVSLKRLGLMPQPIQALMHEL